MLRLLHIEFIKAFNFKALWYLFLIYILALGIILFGVETFINDIIGEGGRNLPITLPKMSLYAFPLVWHNISYLAGFFKVFPAIMIIILVTNEYSYKTIKQQVISGLSRNELFFAKISLIFATSAIMGLLVGIFGFILGFLNTETIVFNVVIAKSQFILVYMLEVFAYGSFGFLIATLVKRSGFAIGVLLLWAYIAEPIIAYKLLGDWGDFLPLRSIGNLIRIPNSQLMKIFGIEFQEYISSGDLYIALAYTLIFNLIVWIIYKRTDL
ncbi:MAG: ABC transporter permease [Bacteroidales bacterium]|jgi:ABC-2 type transport system permease protein|nr:ABC transporter permease [Bacteroidales bacterium]